MSQITTHVLDTTRGRPAAGVPVALSRQAAPGWETLGTGTTDSDGRIADLLDANLTLTAGCYRMHFDTRHYFDSLGESCFYPEVDIVFLIDAGGAHYHIPLLLAAYGYSTYRGS